MICNVCYGMLRGQVGRQFKGSFDVSFDHQANLGSLQKSAEMYVVTPSHETIGTLTQLLAGRASYVAAYGRIRLQVMMEQRYDFLAVKAYFRIVY